MRAFGDPRTVGAILVLLINDHLLKGAAPGWVTGKLSDFAGLVFFPLLGVFLVYPSVDTIRRSLLDERSKSFVVKEKSATPS